MINRRMKLKEVFEDTQRFLSEDPLLKEAVENSIRGTRIYTPDTKALPYERYDGQIRVTGQRSFEAAVLLHAEFPDRRIAVLNFASATNPGGGVTRGASAQEECLCRCSTLYPVLATRELCLEYYYVNRKMNNLHDDTCIYTPDIVICKTDEDIPKRLGSGSFVRVDVISCAAPNLRDVPSNIYNAEGGDVVRITADELYDLHIRRAENILNTAVINKDEIIVLGAFGCGAFSNDPSTVAAAYRDVMKKYRHAFEAAVFAVYCKDRETENYRQFYKAMNDAGLLSC
ncbi:MAG: TIGR02452 family protein [Oscillospiraceae bacterium]|nr:TIGR02452 family protein [Oscillospiraceae bacterium]